MSYFDSTYGKVYYSIVGDGEPILFIHGRTLDSRMWNPQIEYFRGRYKCITYDLNGFGRSEIPKDGYSRVQTLVELLKQIKVDKVNVVSLSLGTHVALSTYFEYPKFFKSLTLLSPTIPGAVASEEFMKDWNAVENAGKEGDFTKAKELWLNCKAFSTIKMNSSEGYKLLKEMVDEYTCWDIFNTPIHNSINSSVLGRLRNINIPTLVLYGQLDYDDFIINGKLLLSSIPNVRGGVVPNVSHMINLEVSDIVNRKIKEFLN